MYNISLDRTLVNRIIAVLVGQSILTVLGVFFKFLTSDPGDVKVGYNA
jgi:hypothetical protein